MTFKEFVRELNGNRVEGELIKTFLYSLISTLGILVLMYYFQFQYIENFMSDFGIYLFLAGVSYSLISPTMRQVRAYKEFMCMAGMMIGMTTGMMAGFLSGYYVGATNGMFYGSIFGITVGVGLGIWTGKCCGVMGFMEGIMAGFMGGLMGAMTAVMMYNDHLFEATIIISIICWVILISLNYMIYKEMKNSERQIKEDHGFVMFISFIIMVITALVMIYGPRGPFLS